MRCIALMATLLVFQVTSYAMAADRPLELDREQIFEMRREVAAMRSILLTCQSQIELFKLVHDTAPDFRRNGWKQLIEQKFLPSAPVNPLAAAEVADRVVVVTGKGMEGDQVSASQAGWVWNETDEVLYPAGGTVAEIQERVSKLVPKTRQDDSLAAEEYLRLGVPAHDRTWHGPDMQRAASVLIKLAQSDAAQLPRFESKRSGKLFDRMCDADNLRVVNDTRMPIQQRAQSLVAYHESLSRILMLYSAAAQYDAIDSRDIIELLGHTLASSVAMLKLAEEQRSTFDKNEPAYAVRMEGNRKMRTGIAAMVAGVVEMLQDEYYFRVSDKQRLLEFMHETFPAFMPILPSETRAEVLRELRRMSSAVEMSDFNEDLTALVNSIEETVALAQ